MKKRILSILLSVIMLLGMMPVTALPTFAEAGGKDYLSLYNSHGGQIIGDTDVVTYYYVDSDITCTAEDAGVSGLSIRDYAEVHIFVEEGATLTCIGSKGSDRLNGGGAGIEVPEHAALYLEGDGTVIAKGGAGADGEDGIQGEKGYFEGHFNLFMLGTAYDYYGGNGGRGGNGGGGAGAGIGTVGGIGGVGGVGGKGDGGDCEEDHMSITAGEKGYHGAMAKPAGTIRTSPTIKLTAVGGEPGQGGDSTMVNGLTNLKYYQYCCTAVPGCTGGGGQGGGAGASVGIGGQGGGGGTGGNGSPAIFREGSDYHDVKLHTGYGGGNTDGNYIEGSNMGQGCNEYIFQKNKYKFEGKDDFPNIELKFGAAGGADSVHVHTFDEKDRCIECTEREWIIDENGVLLKYNGNGGEIVIPEGVTKIDSNLFNGNMAVTGVVFPSTLEEIGSSAFSGSGLASVSFPSSVKTIGHNAFQNCTSLTSVTFPEEGEITILNSTFQGIPLTSVDIPVSVKAIGYNAFRDCASLKNVTVHWAEGEIVTPLSDAFSGIASDCVLYVPPTAAELYKSNTAWGKFSPISATMPYMAYDFESGSFVQKASPITPVQLTSSDSSVVLPGGWYAAGTATIDGSLTFEDDAFIILENGETLTVGGGIIAGGDLTFYAQTTSLDNMGGVQVPGTAGDGIPGIECTGKALDIHGGKIEVYAGKYAAGIGGRESKDGGNVTVCGGYVKAQSRADGAGIGGGRGGAGNAFTIYGGKVDARGSNSSGIGGGWAGAGGTITVNGGEVSTAGNIGSGYQYGGSNGKLTKVIINDGKVSVGGDQSNLGGNGSTVEINGGDIKITQGTLGVAPNGGNADITIRGGNVDSYCYYYAAIGGTDAGNVNVKVYGGSIKAQSKNKDAVDATSLTLYPDTEKCELFTVKDFSGNELSGSPVTEQKDIISTVSGKQQVQIDLDYAHTGMSDSVCDKCGYVEKLTMALFDSKAEAKRIVTQTAGENQSAEMQAIVKEAEKKIDEAKSTEEIENAVWESLAKIEAQKEVEKQNELICRKCRKVHADNFFGKIVCLFNRIVNWFITCFENIKNI